MTQPTLAATSRIRSGGVAVAVALSAANLMGYAFNLVASRRLGPSGYGAVAALLGLVLIGNVVALAVQAVVARRGASDSVGDGTVTAWAQRLGAACALAISGLALVGAPAITEILHLEGPAPALWLAATLGPLTVIGAALGVLQGTERFHALAALYVVAALGKVGGGVVGVLAVDTVSGAMAGTAIGSLLAAAFGIMLVRRVERDRSRPHVGVPKGAGREVAHATYALGAFFALTNVDVVLARHFLSAREAGLYAVGAVVAKAAFWLPSVVPVIAMPGLSDPARRRRTARLALGAVLATGVAVVLAAAVLGSLFIHAVGGAAYLDLSRDIWLFAANGAVLAVAQLLLYSRLAAQDRRAILPLWLLVAAELVVVSLWRHGSAIEIVTVALASALCLAALGVLAEVQEHGVVGRRSRAKRTRGESVDHV